MGIAGHDERSVTERAVAGDERAFAELVDRHLEPTFRVAMAILGNEADARDVTQEVFVRVWRHLPELRDVERFSAWLSRIVINTCRTGLRSRRRRAVREILLDDAQAAAPSLVGDVADDTERVRTIAMAMDRLSVDERSLLALHYHQGLDLAEIGVVLGIPAKTVKSRMHTARRALARALEAAL